MEAVGETTQNPVFIKARSKGEASLCFSRADCVTRVDRWICRVWSLERFFFPPREGICLNWDVAYAGSGRLPGKYDVVVNSVGEWLLSFGFLIGWERNGVNVSLWSQGVIAQS